MKAIAWDDFRIVQMIAQHRSLGGAADVLGLNHSTVFRRLNALEDELGTRVFERSRNGYALTPAGEEMVALAERMAASIVDFERRIAGRDLRPSGELRITTTDTIFTAILGPLLKVFRDRYPEIRLELVVESRALNLSKRDADIAIRVSTEPPETLVGRRIAAVAWAAYGPKGLCCETGVPPAALSGPWIGFGEPINTTAAARWFAQTHANAPIAATLNTVVGIHAAIGSGLGIGLLPCLIGDRSPELVRLGPTIPEAASTLWLLTHPDLKHSARVRAFLDFFGSELTRMRRLFEGETPLAPEGAPITPGAASRPAPALPRSAD